MKYKVRVSEELARTIEVEAESEDEAYHKAYDMYCNCGIVLDADDYVGEYNIRVGDQMTLEDAICALNKLNYSITFVREDDIEDNNESILVESPGHCVELLPSYEALIAFAEETEANG